MLSAGKLLRDSMSAVVMAYYVGECLYVLLRYDSFRNWVQRLPYIGIAGNVLVWILPGMILLLLYLFLIGKRVIAFQLAVWMGLLFTLYLCAALLASTVFFTPFHAWWPGMTWFSRMMITLAITWWSWWAIQKERARSRKDKIISSASCDRSNAAGKEEC